MTLTPVCLSIQWEPERQMLTSHDSSVLLGVFMLTLRCLEQPPEDVVKDEETEAQAQAHTTRKEYSQVLFEQVCLNPITKCMGLPVVGHGHVPSYDQLRTQTRTSLPPKRGRKQQ